MVDYLVREDIIAKKSTRTPVSRTVSGYGSKLPTQWLLRLKDKRWRRVYVMQWSNCGSAYVIVNGKTLFLGSYDPYYTD